MRTLAFVAFVLQAGVASADPVSITGFLFGQPSGAQVNEQLDLSFPDFSVSLPGVTRLIPGLCLEGCGNGTTVPFEQSTGQFSGRSIAMPQLGVVDAEVTGWLTFSGPTDTVSIAPDQLACDYLTQRVTFSGMLAIARRGRTLFDGPISGAGTGRAIFTNRLGPTNAVLDNYQYEFRGLGNTPEPASIVLLGTGVAWLTARARKRARSSRVDRALP
jgi:hypothetical protein